MSNFSSVAAHIANYLNTQIKLEIAGIQFPIVSTAVINKPCKMSIQSVNIINSVSNFSSVAAPISNYLNTQIKLEIAGIQFPIALTALINKPCPIYLII